MLFFNINNKTLMVAFFGLLLFYAYKFSSIEKALLLSYTTSLIFLTGKRHKYILIPPELLNPSKMPSGYYLSSVIGPKFIFGILIFIVLARYFLADKNRSTFLLKDKKNIALLCFVFFSMVSSLIARLPLLSLYFTYQEIIVPIGFYCLTYLVRKSDKRIVYLLLSVIFALGVFQGILSGFQFMNKSTLGTSIEAFHDEDVFTGRDEDPSYYRPRGTLYHANELAFFILPISIFVLSTMLLGEKISKDKRTFYLLLFVVLLLPLFLTISRSAWISFWLTAIFLFFYLEKKLGRKINDFYIQVFLKIFLIFSPILLFVVYPRIQSSFFTFEKEGSFNTRFLLLKESFVVIANHLIFGTGRGLSPYEMFLANPQGLTSHFITPVHMVYLHLLSEVGILALLSLAFSIYLFLKNAYWRLACLKSKEMSLLIGGFFAIISLLVNGLFQPLYSTTLPCGILFILVINNDKDKS